MKRYKIGPLSIELECELPEFQTFMVEIPSEQIDMSIIETTYCFNLCDFDRYTLIGELEIWKSIDLTNPYKWIYRMKNQGSEIMLAVTKDYKKGIYYSAREKSCSSYYIMLYRILQPAVACLAIRKGITVLHAACVFDQDIAFSFSGNSGIGKSTRAMHWIDSLGMQWVSGDRPWIDTSKGCVLGTPWDGKEKIYRNIEVSLKIIFQVHRSAVTCLCSKKETDALHFLISQSFVPMWDPELVVYAYQNVKRLLKKIDVYDLYCSQYKWAAIETYDTVKMILYKKKENKNMQLKKSFEIVQIDDDYMVIPTGDHMEQFGGTVVLNDVSAFLLNHMKEETTQEQLLQLLLEEYEVDEHTASIDIKNIVQKFKELGLLTME